jgi:hypothetical protein
MNEHELLVKHRTQAYNDAKRELKSKLQLELLGLQDLCEVGKDVAFCEKIERRLMRIKRILED